VISSSINAEKVVLGCVLHDQGLGLDLVVTFDESHFEDNNCRLIFKTISHLIKKGEKYIDDLVVIQTLINSKLQKDVGEISKIVNEIYDSTETSAVYDTFKDELLNRFSKKVYKAVHERIGKAIENEESKDISSFVIKEIIKAQEMTEKKKKLKTVSEVAKQLAHRVENYDPNEQKIRDEEYIEWFNPKMNEYLTRIRPSELVVIGARPGTAKTSTALQLTTHNAKRGKNCLFFSLESSIDDLVESMLNQETEINYEDWLDFPKRERTFRSYAEEKYLQNITMIDDCFHLDAILAKSRLYDAMNKIDLIVVDYLQLIKTQRGHTRENEVANISRELRHLSLNLEIPVICLCQIGRDVEKDGRLPKLSDLRESGAIEQDATRVNFICRPIKDKYGESQNPDEGYESKDFHHLFIQRKCRKGPANENLWFQFTGRTQKTTDIEKF